MEFTQLLSQYSQRVQNTLLRVLPPTTESPEQLHQAMRYVALSGGKHLRPALVYIVGKAFGASLEKLDLPACAIELIHCYSLVHDDLPAMDNDAVRRGQASCHIAFSEATAILVGDALQTLAFKLLTDSVQHGISSTNCLSMIDVLAQASGSHGMAGGQMIDLEVTGKPISLEKLYDIYHLKTSALIAASLKLGALAAGCVDSSTLNKLEQYATLLGRAFQIQDDILDLTTTTDKLGKPQGSDLQNNKCTALQFLSVTEAEKYVAELLFQAKQSIQSLNPKISQLNIFTDMIQHRQF